jgi:uncharacterized protein YgbK (DUF1537 family)
MSDRLLLAYYGDDFTGSTDALEFICRAGARTVLFIEPPTAARLRAFPGLQAFGVAGKTRALSPQHMEQALLPAFEQIRASGVRHVHYKTCSTFDSSPVTGSIGKAIDCGIQVFHTPLVPVLGGTPALGRYCVFGNLFAQMGIGSNGKIYRLDRHPSMSKHPVTPADESDLRLHLQKQTAVNIGLIDLIRQEQPIGKWKEVLDEEGIVLIDALQEAQLLKIGAWIDAQYAEQPLFSAGSSAIEMALGKYWQQEGALTPVTKWPQAGKASPLLVVSGSCSPVTAGQITWAKANGFEEVSLDAVKACNGNGVEADLLLQIITLLQEQKNVVVHTGTKQNETLSSEKLGNLLGTIAHTAVLQAGVKRVVVSGGDTSSYAARAMEIEAVEMVTPLVSGAPLCRAYSSNSMINGIEVNFKGGQVGAENYFGVLLNGTV